MKHLLVLGVAVILAGCATSNPILAPNAHLQQVGQEQARRDISQCKALADRSLPPTPAERAAQETALGGRRGEALGVTGGVITGAPAGSGPLAPVRPIEGTPAWKDFVSRCLAERAYEVTGWEK